MDAVADSKQAEVNINVFEDVEPGKLIVVSWSCKLGLQLWVEAKSHHPAFTKLCEIG